MHGPFFACLLYTRADMSLRSDVKHDDDLLYYNAVLYNNSSAPIVASISDIRGQSLIDRPEDWHMSVVRFVLGSQIVPLARLPLATSGLTTTLQFTIRYAGVDYPDTIALPLMPYASTAQGNAIFGQNTVISYDQLIDLFNQCLENIFLGIPGLPAGAVAPKFAYNAATGLITMYYQTSFNPLVIEVWANSLLYAYLASMPATLFDIGAADGKDYRLNLESSSVTWVPIAVRDGYPATIQVADMPGQVLALSQQAQSQNLWDGASTIYLTTSTIPIQSEYQPFNSSQSQNFGFSTASNPIISDFALDSESPMVLRQKLEYLPTAEYRMIHLAGREPIKKIDMQFWYIGSDGRPYQVYISPGQSCSVKLLFRRHFESS